jgi:hypothetical protein
MFPDNRNFLRWNRLYEGTSAGTINASTKYRIVSIRGRDYIAHRLIWLLVHGEPVPEVMDHADRDRSNNRLVNLRAATRGQNGTNTPARRNNARGVKGVYPTGWGRFTACIRYEKKLVYLGTFTSIEEASKAYQDAAVRLYGEFARWE